MKQISIAIFFAAFMLVAVGSQNGYLTPEIPSAFASNDNGNDNDNSNDNANDNGNDNSKDSDTASCDCPPGITACTCADGSPGEASKDSPSAAGPSHYRSF